VNGIPGAWELGTLRNRQKGESPSAGDTGVVLMVFPFVLPCTSSSYPALPLLNSVFILMQILHTYSAFFCGIRDTCRPLPAPTFRPVHNAPRSDKSWEKKEERN